MSVVGLGGNRRGEMRITRFLRNGKVSVGEMVATASARTAAAAAGRHLVAIQDTTSLRDGGDGRSLCLHATIVADARDGALLGVADARVLARTGGAAALRKARPFAEKESRRWLEATKAAAALARAAGAASLTVVADREGDLYEEFALCPPGVDLVIRAAQDRTLAAGGRLFAAARGWAEAGRLVVELPAAPGRRARRAVLSVRCGPVAILRPGNRGRDLPSSVALHLVEAVERDPPAGASPAQWRILTTRAVAGFEGARAAIDLYRARWTIEQLFRTMKTRGFDIEAVRIAEGPFEKLATACLIAAVTVLQLVRERDGAGRRPLADAFAPQDAPVLEALNGELEGATARQKNPHPQGSLARAAWTLARLGGWTGYYGKPGPVTLLRGLNRFHAAKLGYELARLV